MHQPPTRIVGLSVIVGCSWPRARPLRITMICSAACRTRPTRFLAGAVQVAGHDGRRSLSAVEPASNQFKKIGGMTNAPKNPCGKLRKRRF